MSTKEQQIAPSQLISNVQSKLLGKKDRYDKKYKIACIGSVNYDNITRIKEFLSGLKNNVDENDILIISGGRKNGADSYVRKYANYFGLTYLEYNPAFTTKNLYSAMSEWFYGKEYSIRHIYSRNKLMIDNCNMLVIFLNLNEKLSKEFDNIIQLAQKKDIKILIIN